MNTEKEVDLQKSHTSFFGWHQNGRINQFISVLNPEIFKQIVLTNNFEIVFII